MCNIEESISAFPPKKIFESGLIDPRSILFGPSTSYLTMRERTAMLEKESRYTGPGVRTGLIVGPPGVGKSTIIQELSISGEVGILPLLTTRQAVTSDAVSLDRIFVSPDEFYRMESEGKLLAISNKAGAQGNYQMAISKQSLYNMTNDPRPTLLDKTFAGWDRLLQEMASDPKLDEIRNSIRLSHHFIFLLPPDMLTLSRRLFHRNRTPNSESSKEEKREELKRGKEFEKLLDDSLVPNISFIVNDDVRRVVTEIGRILRI